MGYTTDFYGVFKLNKTLDDETKVFLKKLSHTRRVKRNLPDKYGIEGEFYVEGGGLMGQAKEKSIIDYNRPPCTQPGLWCQWEPSDCGNFIAWNQAEKFYCYVEWLQYIIDRVLTLKGYSITGNVLYQGEDVEDRGLIKVKDNIIKVKKTNDYKKITELEKR